ncbi:acyltransferase, partial [Acidovorax sp. HMWF018]|uniref:nitrilase-related carbon-nitrogen hydrolase n=1 Tax=Acidovorax sp. HMWF018 TaxID=2056855 RepID=UPI000D3B967B
MKVAAIQMVSSTALDDNLRVTRELLEQAAQGGAELAVLPEYFCLMGYKDTDKLALRETAGAGVIQQFLADTARALQMWIVGGTLPMATDAPDRVRNTTLVFDPTGACVARYDKIHLFRFSNGAEQYDEGRVIDAGDTPVQFDLQARSGQRWRVGLSVCYDLRFPELYRAHARAGADLLL